jgi:hypothetical protein
MGGEEKKFAKKTNQLGLMKGKKKKNKGQLELATLVSPMTGRDEKGAPISAPSIHIGALVGTGSLWPVKWCFYLTVLLHMMDIVNLFQAPKINYNEFNAHLPGWFH